MVDALDIKGAGAQPRPRRCRGQAVGHALPAWRAGPESKAVDDDLTFEQAGRLLALLHAQGGPEDPNYEADEKHKTLARIDGTHRIDRSLAAQLRASIQSWPTPPMQVVPTHGDWQPRNWLIHEGLVSVIDFGRAGLRPRITDFSRLAAQDFARDPSLETAFLKGYGDDPRDPDAWLRQRVREAVGTATWAYDVGDEEFEAQGHRMIAEVIPEL